MEARREPGLFRPDLLSASEAPAPIPLEGPGLARALTALETLWGFGADRLESLATVAEATEIVIVDSRFVLKARSGPPGAARLAWEAAVGAVLHRRGAPVARPIECPGGTLYGDFDGATWMLLEMVPGGRFSGAVGELGEAGRAFGRLARASDGLPGVPRMPADLGELPGLIRQGVEDPGVSLGTADLARLELGLDRVDASPDLLERDLMNLHLDFHPANLVFRDGTLEAVLDLEDLEFAPLAVASGFAAFKLGREACVNRGADGDGPTGPLVAAWRDGLEEGLGRTAPSGAELAIGAEARVLMLVHRILDHHLRLSDPGLTYALPGQVNALHEIDALFGPSKVPGT